MKVLYSPIWAFLFVNGDQKFFLKRRYSIASSFSARIDYIIDCERFLFADSYKHGIIFEVG